MLPDRGFFLEPVDRVAQRREGLIPVRSGRGDKDVAQVADLGVISNQSSVGAI